ncbi:MAG: phage tail tape measure protein [Cyanobacteria bacterium P01_E01_bin.42]
MADTSLTLKIIGDGSHAASVLDGLMGRASAANKAFGGKNAGAAGKAYGDAANAAVKFNRQGAKAAEMGDRLQSVGQSLTNNVTKPLVGAGKGALKMGMQCESAMNRVGALTGLDRASDQFKTLEKQSLDLGSTTAFSASQAAEAQSFLAMAGFKSNDILATTPGLLSLASAGQMDLGKTADIASNIMSGYSQQLANVGSKSQQIAKINDVLANTMTSSNTDISMLGQSFKYVAPIADNAGIAFSQTASALGVLGDAGRQGSQGETDLRNFILNLSAPTGVAQKALDRLGISTKDLNDEFGNFNIEKASTALKDAGATSKDLSAIFGKTGITGAQILVNSLDKLGELTTANELHSQGKAADIAKKQMAGLGGATTEFNSALEGLGIAVSQSGLQKLAEGVTRLGTKAIQGLSRLPKPVLAFATALGGAAAAVGPVLVGVGGIMKMWPLLQKGAGALKAFSLFSKIGPAMGAIASVGVGPILGIAAAVGAIGFAAFKFAPAIGSFFKGIASGFQSALSSMGGLGQIFAPLLQSLAPLRSSLATVWPEGFFAQSQQGVMAANQAGNSFGQLLGKVVSVAATIGGALMSAFVGIGTAIGTALGFALFRIPAMIQGVFIGIQAQFLYFRALVTTTFSGIGAVIRSAFTGALISVMAAISGIGAAFSGAVVTIRGAIAGIGAAFGQIPGMISGAMSQAVAIVQGAARMFMSAGAALMRSLAAGIQSAVGAAVSAVSGAVGKFRAMLPFSPAKTGALSDLDKTGPAFVRTFAAGISPNPLLSAVGSMLAPIPGMLSSSPAPAPVSQARLQNASSGGGGSVIHVTYSPTYHIAEGSDVKGMQAVLERDRASFRDFVLQVLREHEAEQLRVQY